MAKLTNSGKILIVAVAAGLIGFGAKKAGLLDQYLQKTTQVNQPQTIPTNQTNAQGELITKGNLIINGSTSLLPVVNALKDSYQKKYPDIKFTVGYQGTSVGIEALIGGACDISAASRSAKEKEITMAQKNQLELSPHKIAIDAIAVIVNKSNPIYGLSKQDLANIYTGKITNWSQVRGPNLPIRAIAREKKAGMHSLFKKLALNGQDYGSNIQYAFDTTSMLHEIIENKGAIGLATITQSANQSQVKIIGLSQDSESPAINPQIALNQINFRVISQESYPLTRPMFLYTTSTSSPLAKQFVQFAKSVEGQSVIKSKNFVPVLDLD